MAEPILSQRDGDVTTITLNRPEAGNRQTEATWAQVAAMFDVAAKESRLIVFRGAGDDFCLGRESMGQPTPVQEAYAVRDRAKRYSIFTGRFETRKFRLSASCRGEPSGLAVRWQHCATLRLQATAPLFSFPKWRIASCPRLPCLLS